MSVNFHMLHAKLSKRGWKIEHRRPASPAEDDFWIVSDSIDRHTRISHDEMVDFPDEEALLNECSRRFHSLGEAAHWQPHAPARQREPIPNEGW